MEITNKARKLAAKAAGDQAQLMRARYRNEQYKSWEDIEANLGIKIPLHIKAQPLKWVHVSDFATYWQQSWEARLELEISESKDNKVKIVTGDIVQSDCHKWGNLQLFPEQEATFRRLYEDAFTLRKIRAAFQDGETGAGKSYLAVGLIAQAIADGALNDPMRKMFPMYSFIIFTPKNVVESYSRVIELAGLGKYLYNQTILVTSYSQLSTAFGDILVEREEDMINPDAPEKLKWSPMINPVMIVWDEAHNLNNWNTWKTRCARCAGDADNQTFHLLMSATPFEKVNDARTFLHLLNEPVMGVRADTEAKFRQFASILDDDPGKPNRAACKRLRQTLSPWIYSLPRAKWAHKQINHTFITDFDSDKDRQVYRQAHEKYKEVCRKMGKNTEFGEFEQFVAMNNFRKTVDPLRAPMLARRALDNYRAGNLATVIGTAFKETIVRTVFQLAEAGVPREHISIIWGGGKNINPADIMTQAEIDEMLARSSTGERIDKDDFRRLKITLNYIEEQHTYDETPEAQAYRHRRMAELRLRGTQSADQRQKEIDAFQTGSSRICLFTLASGGVGLSLDKDKPHLLQREGWFTPVWNGKEFKQALGRTVRRASLADCHQYIMYMAGTVEEYHVAPLLDTKLKCIAEITNRTFDVFDILAQDDTPAQPVKFMSDEEALEAAESGHIVYGEADDDDENDDDKD